MKLVYYRYYNFFVGPLSIMTVEGPPNPQCRESYFCEVSSRLDHGYSRAASKTFSYCSRGTRISQIL